MKKIQLFLLFICITSFAASSVVLAGNVDSTYKYAWGENIGWLNFGTTEGDVTIGTSQLTGYAWGENVGWISLSCSNTSSCATVNYGVTRSSEVLSGYAWGENVGWISFNCANTGTCATSNYRVTALLPQVDLYGYAWGENVGWISFNCLNTGICGTFDYRVSISTTGGGEGGVVIVPPPPSSATPTPTPASSSMPTPTATPVSGGGGPAPVGTPTPTLYGGGGTVPAPTSSLPPVAQSTPTSGPLGLSPSTPPPLVNPPEEPSFFEEIADRAGEVIDRIGDIVFGRITPAEKSVCEGGIGITACGATGVGVLAVVAALFAGLLQGEWLAVAFGLFSVLGLREEENDWGRVYDARTKRPLPFAKVQLFDGLGNHLKTTYADRDGRYGFPAALLSGTQTGGRIVLKAAKPSYQFPSTQNLPDPDYFVYGHPYMGSPVPLENGVPKLNIPLDPQAAGGSRLYDFGAQLFSRASNRFIGFVFFVGLFAVPLNYYLSPTMASLALLLAFLAFHFFRIVAFIRPYGLIIDSSTGKALPYALVVLHDEQGNQVDFAISDRHGRYVLPVEGGNRYRMTVHSPVSVGSQRVAEYQAAPRSRLGKTAWITAPLRI